VSKADPFTFWQINSLARRSAPGPVPINIEPASVREEAEAAGFVLDAESTMLANKEDPHSIKVFDPSIKGETDRFAYRFVKPDSPGGDFMSTSPMAIRATSTGP
jgi:hypothetical protein